MKWQVIVVGKPAFSWAQAGINEYLDRLKRTVSIELIILKNGTPSQVAPKALELSQGSWRVILDEKGKHLRSMELAGWIREQENQSRKKVSLLIGGAEGHDLSVKQAANEMWSLSAMTLQHEMAAMLLLEQVYRGYSIMRGEPYHRE